jgi:hypothetical protein
MDQPPAPRHFSFQRRFWLVLAVWCLAVIAAATAFPHPSRAKYVLLFPYGLITIIISALGAKSQSAPHVIFGWLMYVALTLASVFTGNRLGYLCLYTLLCVLLLLNVIGCHMMFHGYPKS